MFTLSGKYENHENLFSVGVSGEADSSLQDNCWWVLQAEAASVLPPSLLIHVHTLMQVIIIGLFIRHVASAGRRVERLLLGSMAYKA